MANKLTRNLVIAAVALGILAGGGYAAYRGYKSIRQTRLVKRAKEYIAKSDQRRAMLCLQRAYRANPKDVEICRLMAELLERGGSPEALRFRKRVVELNPKSNDDRLALARIALAVRDLQTTTNALDKVSEAGKKTAPFHNVAGAVSFAMGQPAAAEAHFLEASRLEPTNLVYRLQFAAVRIHQTNLQAQAEARAALQQLADNPVVRCQALRELMNDAALHNQTNVVLSLSRQLVRETNSLFEDRLKHLTLLHQTGAMEYLPSLAALQREATNSPASVERLASWQMIWLSPSNNLFWLNNLPPILRTNLPAAEFTAACFGRLTNWTALQSFVQPQNWGGLEFERHAYLALALRGQQLAAASKTEWDQALKFAQGQNGKILQQQSLAKLLQWAAGWNWTVEAEELLWILVDRYPDFNKADEILNRFLYTAGRTDSLMKFYGKLVTQNPADLAAKNNLAMTALLLNAQEVKPHDLAREVCEKAPTNSAYLSTYAFSLYLQKRGAEALKVIERLTPTELENPGIAGYYGLILRANGQGPKATKYLSLASKAVLLPEEKKLFGLR